MLRKTASLIGLFVLSGQATHAAPVSYAFDSITAFDFARPNISLTGVLRNASSPTTVTFTDQTNSDNIQYFNRCVPVILTMLEKPGRYYLNMTVDSAAGALGIISCGLELRQ